MSHSQTNPITHFTGTCGIAIGNLQIICKVDFRIGMSFTHLPKVPAVPNDGLQTRMPGCYSASSPPRSQSTRGVQSQPEREEVC